MNIMDTEDKKSWVEAAEEQERAFVADRLPQLGLSGIINPEKEFNRYVPDLIVDDLLSDLKSQFTPFFKVGVLYDIDPQYSVTFNLKDGRRYARKYPKIVVFFDVHWQTTEMTIRGRDYQVEPMHRTYAGYLDDVMKAIDECGNQKHTYQRRINDADGNALESWLFDVRKLNLLREN
jgi:hypothetical protein